MKSEDSSATDSNLDSTEQHDSSRPDGLVVDVTTPREIGGRKTGLDPTRYGDWEKNGRCIDF